MPATLWGLAFGPRAAAFLDGMPPGKIRAQISKKARSLILDPFPPGCKKLAVLTYMDEPLWRIRSGDYRVLYVVRRNPNEVVVIAIDDRKDVYK